MSMPTVHPSLLAAGFLGAVGVAIGAYSAHGLESSLLEQGIEVDAVAKRIDQCEVGVRYHLLHVVALLAIGCSRLPQMAFGWAAAFWTLGVGLFSGGLYSLAFLGILGHWAIVPLGGLSFILGWVCVLFGAFSSRDSRDSQR
jgi:uncharacterized membrane protein YgdD (TMEM256/DUF423 family)